MSVADDGGSSGRLRRDLGVAAPGDLRKCLVALATDGGPWPAAFEHRFATGELAGHALGNLLIVGLAESLGDLNRALDEAGRLLGAVGRVVPATVDAVTLEADIGGERGGRPGRGRVAGRRRGREPGAASCPPTPPATPDALEAIAHADQIVLAPGSLYTSVLGGAVRARDPGRGRPARRAGSCTSRNLRADDETAGLDGTDQLRVLLDHGVRVDVLLHDPRARAGRERD